MQVFNIEKYMSQIFNQPAHYNKTLIEDNFTLIRIYIYCDNNTPATEFCRAARGENIVFHGHKP